MDRVKSLIRDVPDFPKPGIMFKDITPVLADGPALATVIKTLAARYATQKPTHIVGVESRGFIFGAALALAMGVGFVPLRKPGKLPYKKRKREYLLEYGKDAIEIHEDALKKGDRVVLVDDLIATGGTAKAGAELIRDLGAEVIEVAFVVELAFLKGREKLAGEKVFSLITY